MFVGWRYFRAPVGPRQTANRRSGRPIPPRLGELDYQPDEDQAFTYLRKTHAKYLPEPRRGRAFRGISRAVSELAAGGAPPPFPGCCGPALAPPAP